MSANYEVEEEYEEGITLVKIAHFFKKGWLRMVIYIAVLCVLVTAIALPVKVFAFSDPVAVVSVEYTYAGAEKGLAPDGSVLDTDNIISAKVLNAAVKSAGLEKTVKSISDLRTAMRVESVQSKEYKELVLAAKGGDSAAAEKLRTLYPTQYNIIITDPGELGLSDKQAEQLLNKVVLCYFDDFLKRYAAVEVISSDGYNLSASDQIEFVDVYDIYIERLNALSEYLRLMQTNYPDFFYESAGITFSGLAGELRVLKNNYIAFNSNVLSKNIWRDPSTAATALQTKRDSINDRLTPLKDYIVGLKEQIEKISPTTVSATDGSGSHVITTSYPQNYYTYQDRLDAANREVLEYNTSLAEITRRLGRAETAAAVGSAVITETENDLAELEEQTVALIEKINSAVDNMYKTTYLTSSVKKVQEPVVTREGAEFALWLVYVIAIIVGLLAACIVTGVKIGANSARAKSKAATDSETKAEAEEKQEDKK